MCKKKQVMKLEKMVIGIDISKDDFHCCARTKHSDGSQKIKGSKKFPNTMPGFRLLLEWVEKRNKERVEVSYVMEATGVYYEELAYFLYDTGEHACVVLPNKIKHYAKSLNIKSKTDKIDSATIARFGMERSPKAWRPMAPKYRELRELCRERLSLTKDRTRAKNQVHAIENSHSPSESVQRLKRHQIDFYDEMIEDIEGKISFLVKEDRELERKVANICKVKGLRAVTVITVICEANGFTLAENIRQAVSYAGLDVVFEDSGKRTGNGKISKKGNARIRQALYMPGVSACTRNPKIKDLYGRICEANPKIKNKGIVAGMRKLLILIYVLWKKDEEYDPNYQWKAGASGNAED